MYALNHMTVPEHRFTDLLDVAVTAGCIGIECRNDLAGPLFDGMAPDDAGALVRSKGLRLLALAEVKAFNDWSDDKARAADALISIAAEAGAEAVALIPRCDGQGLGNGERQANLRVALRELAPRLEAAGLIGLVEPLGFERSSLRYKAEALEAIEGLDQRDRFLLVHDTFHHHLAGETGIFADATGIVHISGVINPDLSVSEMADADRVHVDREDRLGNIDQLRRLQAAGYAGPISVEAFSPDVHASPDPTGDLVRSFDFVRGALAAEVA